MDPAQALLFLTRAVENGMVELAVRLLSAGLAVPTPELLLKCGALPNGEAMAVALLDHGLDANAHAPGSEGDSLLFRAAEKGVSTWG